MIRREPTDPETCAFNGSMYRGLTKREYFATVALKGIMGSGLMDQDFSLNARNAVKQADELIEALNAGS